MSQSESSKKHYQKNRLARRLKIKKRMQSVINFVQGFKAGSCCLSCGETERSCLDFHHREPEHKSFNVCSMPRMGFSIQNILAEIQKCNILCANCHRKFHRGVLAHY